MRWIRYTADGRTAYGSLHGDTVTRSTANPGARTAPPARPTGLLTSSWKCR